MSTFSAVTEEHLVSKRSSLFATTDGEEIRGPSSLRSSGSTAPRTAWACVPDKRFAASCFVVVRPKSNLPHPQPLPKGGESSPSVVAQGRGGFASFEDRGCIFPPCKHKEGVGSIVSQNPFGNLLEDCIGYERLTPLLSTSTPPTPLPGGSAAEAA